jgi:Fic family protein
VDAKQFAPNAPGRLVPALNRNRHRDTGFIPDPLPLDWEPPPQTRALMAAASAALEQLQRAGERARAPQLASAFLQLREAACSSVSSRGAQATAALLAFAPPAAGAYRDPLKAWRNAYRYRAVLRAGQAALEGARPPALRALIGQIHAGLFEGQPRRSVFPGRLRRGPIQMGDRAHYVPPPYEWVVPCLAALERGLARHSEIDPLVRAFMTHYQFVTIHPFADGNGRVGRILLALMLNRALGAPPQPPLLYVSPFLARHKGEYTGRLFRVNTHGEWPVWIDFCFNAVIAEARDAARRVALFDRLREQLRARLRVKPGGGALLDELLVAPAFSEPQFAGLCARHGKDARTEMERLAAAGAVRAAGPRWRPRQFYLPSAVDLLSRDLPAQAQSGAGRAR